MAYPDLILARNPTGYWRLDETSGATINDQSAFNLAGTLSGSGYTQGVAGLPMGGAQDKALSGSANVAIEVAAAGILDITGAITLECWLKHTTSNFTGCLMFKAAALFSGSAATITYDLGLLSGTLHFQISNGSTAFDLTKDFTGYAANTWHLITATWDGTTAANGVKILIDGAVAAQAASTIGAIQANASPLKIAGRNGSGNAFEHFPGVINEVALINAVTSLATHQAVYAAGLLVPFEETVSGALAPTSALALAVARSLSGALAPGASLAVSISRALAGAVAPAGALGVQANVSLAGAVAPAGALLAELERPAPPALPGAFETRLVPNANRTMGTR